MANPVEVVPLNVRVPNQAGGTATAPLASDVNVSGIPNRTIPSIPTMPRPLTLEEQRAAQTPHPESFCPPGNSRSMPDSPDPRMNARPGGMPRRGE